MIRHAGRALGRFLGQGLMGTGKAAVVGGASYYAQKAVAPRIPFMQAHPLSGPIGMVVIGHLAKKKFPVVGTALVGAGAYGGALAYDLNKSVQTTATAPSTGTSALVQPDEMDVRALVQPDNIQGLEVDSNGPVLDTSEVMGL
jgi:hypothetical protein